MKKSLILGGLFLLGLVSLIYSQKIQEKSMVINIEVPVRVFDGQRFVDNLTLKDFEVYENGLPQRVEAVYLVKKKSIERSEERKRFFPQTKRNFYLFFEISEYNARLGEAVSYFVRNIVYPDDTLTIVTPIKTYRLRGKALELQSRKKVVQQLKGILRRDALLGSSAYRHVVKELERLARSMVVNLEENESENFQRLDQAMSAEYDQMSIGEKLQRYVDLLAQLENYRKVNQSLLLNFANFLKNQAGQKYVFIFYQREFIPKIEPRILYQYMNLYQDKPNIMQTLAGVFNFYRREIAFDVEAVKKAYADASVGIHFLFITRPKEKLYGVQMEEHSEDIFGAFKEMAQASGGYAEASFDAYQAFRHALEASQNYYLIYYTPRNYVRDGKFRKIEVRIKGQPYRVVHRVGYFAD